MGVMSLGGKIVVVIRTVLRGNSIEYYQVNTCNAKTMLERKSKDQRGKTERVNRSQ